MSACGSGRDAGRGSHTQLYHACSEASKYALLLQAFGTLLCSTEAPEGSAAALPYISQLLGAAGRCSHPWSQAVSALAGGKASLSLSLSGHPAWHSRLLCFSPCPLAHWKNYCLEKKKMMKIAMRLRYARVWYVDLDFEKFLNQSYTRIYPLAEFSVNEKPPWTGTRPWCSSPHDCVLPTPKQPRVTAIHSCVFQHTWCLARAIFPAVFK